MTTTIASFISDFWNDQLVANELQGLFLVLAGFIGSFGFIRMSTRIMRSPRVSWWPGSVVSDSGVHLHHLVFGIVAMMAAGTLGFTLTTSPGYEISAALFGIGIGLTIDEFALWVHLDDVYWSREGRSSVDATVLAAAMMGLVLLGFRPFDVKTGTAADTIATIIAAVILLTTVFTCFAKSRVMHGTVGLLVFPVAIYGACRLAKPDSLWARRRYGERNPGKQSRAVARFPADRRTARFKESFRDAVGGTPTEIYEAKLAERAATEGAAGRVRERAEAVADAENEATAAAREPSAGPGD
jgi:hypothetical protein